MQFIGGVKGGEDSTHTPRAEAPASRDDKNTPEISDDDIPF
jgi:hypothetical protein